MASKNARRFPAGNRIRTKQHSRLKAAVLFDFRTAGDIAEQLDFGEPGILDSGGSFFHGNVSFLLEFKRNGAVAVQNEPALAEFVGGYVLIQDALFLFVERIDGVIAVCGESIAVRLQIRRSFVCIVIRDVDAQIKIVFKEIQPRFTSLEILSLFCRIFKYTLLICRGIVNVFSAVSPVQTAGNVGASRLLCPNDIRKIRTETVDKYPIGVYNEAVRIPGRGIERSYLWSITARRAAATTGKKCGTKRKSAI